MQIAPALNHINIRTRDMDRLIRFYRDVCGFEPGYRPPFSNSGAWLYMGETVLIHLVETTEPFSNEGTAINHFALNGTGLADYLARLRSLNVPYRVGVAPELNLHQVFAHDPEGNRFEVLFDGSEAEGVDITAYEGGENTPEYTKT